MAIRLKLDGFDQLLKDIEQAEGNVDKATENALRQSAVTMQNELKSAMVQAGVARDLIGRMPSFEIEKEFGRITARVGYRKGEYNPRNLTDGYKAAFINYGTPRRSKHGQIKERGYIAKAKRRARPKLKAQQEEALKKILARLKKK